MNHNHLNSDPLLTEYESSYLEDGSDYSDSSELDWILNGGSSMVRIG